MKSRILTLVLVILLIILGAALQGCCEEETYGPPQVHFPEDEGAHPEYGHEWWYLNSTLTDTKGKEYTAMVCFFNPPIRIFSMSDVETETFYHEVPSLQDLITTEYDYAEGTLNLYWNDTDRWYRTESDSLSYSLEVIGENIGLDFNLVSQKEPLLVGGDGLVEWKDGIDASTHYYSLTRLRIDGAIEISGETIDVEGIGWMDHQWWESMSDGGWNWFSVQLDNQTELIVWEIFNPDGSAHSREMTIMFPDETIYYTDTVKITKLDSWVSPDTEKEYGTLWRVWEDSRDIDLEIKARFVEQEVLLFPDLSEMASQIWEGGTTISGEFEGETVTGVGYAELVPPPEN